MATREAVEACLTLLSASLNLDIGDATVEGWDVILLEAYDEDLPGACVEVLKRWETTFLPPPAIILAECRRQCHRRMKDLDDEDKQIEGLARLARLKDIIEKKGQVS